MTERDTPHPNVLSFPDAQRIEEEASVWLARMDGGTLSPGQRTELQRWAGQSALHRETFERLRRVWDGADILAQLDTIEPHAQAGRAGDGPAGVWWPRMAIAACAMVIGLVLGALALHMDAVFPHRGGEHITATYITEIGENTSATLSDGSVVTLDTDTALRVTMTDTSRTIHLERGQAHFDVAKDPDRPFSVFANDGIVRAIGTSFSVQVKDDSVEVIVSDGIVELLTKVEGDTQGNEDTTFTTIGALTANQNAVFGDRLEHVERMSEQRVARELLWREGLVEFSGESLGEVIAEVSRYTETTIEIENPQLAQISIGGIFVISDVDHLFQGLQAAVNITVDVVDDAHVVLRAGDPSMGATSQSDG